MNVLTPTDGYRVERDTAYDNGPRRRLDLYVPNNAPADAPVVIFFYGGGWTSGSKDVYPFVGQAFASRGYVTAIPDYRLYPEVRYRGFLEDAAAAVAFIAHRAESRPILLVGHSAGAYIVAMLALDRRWLEAAGMDHCHIAAAAGLAGPYDFLPLQDDTLAAIFAPAGPETQPVTYVDPSDPPMLLVTGDDDREVKPANSLRLAQRLRDVGVPVATRVYDRLGHIGLVAALADPLRFIAPVLDDVVGFFRYEAGTRPRRTARTEVTKTSTTSGCLQQ